MRARGQHHQFRSAWRIPSMMWPFGSREKIVTIIDLGAHKIACGILACSESSVSGHSMYRSAKLLSHVVVRSAGFSQGHVLNMAAAETCVRRAVAKAEAQAGVTAEDVIVTAPFASMTLDIFEACFVREDETDADNALYNISLAAQDHFAALKRKPLHLFFMSNSSSHKTLDVAAISLPKRDLRPIYACLQKSLLRPVDVIAGPIASAYAVTTPDERQSGVLVLDFGAGSVGFSFFIEGTPVISEVLAGGSAHISHDIAKSFALKPFEAERLKVRHASVFDGLQADIDLPFLNGETGEPISKFALNKLVRSRVSSILKAVKNRLKSCGYSEPVSGVVLTGGGSSLPGMQSLATQVFACGARLGNALPPGGLRGDASLSGLIGACHYVCLHQLQSEIEQAPSIGLQSTSYAARIGHWLKTSF